VYTSAKRRRLGGTTRAALLALPVCLAACAGEPEPRAPVTSPGIASAAVTLTTPVVAAPTLAPPAKLEVKGPSGSTDPTSAAQLEPARVAIEKCRPGTGGKIDVSLFRRGSGLYLHVEPGTSLDPRAGHCVLEALSTVDLEPTGGNVGGSAIPRGGFTSLITISW
jgi:hypothetical protein